MRTVLSLHMGQMAEGYGQEFTYHHREGQTLFFETEKGFRISILLARHIVGVLGLEPGEVLFGQKKAASDCSLDG